MRWWDEPKEPRAWAQTLLFRRILTARTSQGKAPLAQEGQRRQGHLTAPAFPHACRSQTPATGPWAAEARDTSERRRRCLLEVVRTGARSKCTLQDRPRDPSCRIITWRASETPQAWHPIPGQTRTSFQPFLKL